MRTSIDDNIRTALLQLLALTGAEPAAAQSAHQTNAPVELLVDLPIAAVVDALVFHIGDMFWHCEHVISSAGAMVSHQTEPDVFDDAVCSLWGTVVDHRFHAFQCLPYLERIREELQRNLDMDSGHHLRPSVSMIPRSAPVDSCDLANAVLLRTSLPHDEATGMSTDIAGYASACQDLASCTEVLAVAAEEGLPRLGAAFAQLTAAILRLALTLLQADVAVARIMSNQLDADADSGY